MESQDLPTRELLDSAPDGIVVVDVEGVIVFVNQTTQRLFGYSPDELVGRPINTLIPERFHQVHRQHRLLYGSDPRVRPMGLGLDLVARHRDGSEFPVEISLSPLKTGGSSLFTAIVRDISERKAFEEERKALEMQLETERERDRIAMDLHDGIMQDIYAASLGLELAADTTGASPETRESIERVIDQLHTVVRNIRSYIFDLRPREFNGNLTEALSNLASEFQQNSQIATQAFVQGEDLPNLTTSLTVYNIAHESLSNIQRHAHATQVSISLEISDGTGTLQVVDDGVGFDVAINPGQGHRGLRNMRARAHTIGAELVVDTSPGQGTRLTLRFPLPPSGR